MCHTYRNLIRKHAVLRGTCKAQCLSAREEIRRNKQGQLKNIRHVGNAGHSDTMLGLIRISRYAFDDLIERDED